MNFEITENHELIRDIKNKIRQFFISNKNFDLSNLPAYSCYFIGSLAHGGFNEYCSDIDLAIIFHTQPNAEIVSSLIDHLKKIDLPIPNDRISVFWSVLPIINEQNTQIGRFPEVDKLDLIKYGEIFYGIDIKNQLRVPSHLSLIKDACQFSLSKLFYDKKIFKFVRHPDLLIENIRVLTKLILFPIRFMYTADTQEIAINECAVQYMITRKEFDAETLELIQEAYLWRQSGKIPHKTHALSLISKNFRTLYNAYIEKYISLLNHYGETELIAELNKWKTALYFNVTPSPKTRHPNV